MENQDPNIGIIALKSDQALEDDLKALLPKEIKIHIQKIDYTESITIDSLGRLLSKISAAVDLLPKGIPYKGIGFACTSGSVAIGHENIEKAIQLHYPGAFCFTPMSSALESFKRHNLKKISLLTPYPDEVSEMVKKFFESYGLEILSHHNLDLHYDHDIYNVSPESIAKKALEIVDPGAEGIFISCTTLRAVEAISFIQKTLNKPVVTSNQAFAAMAALKAKG